MNFASCCIRKKRRRSPLSFRFLWTYKQMLVNYSECISDKRSECISARLRIAADEFASSEAVLGSNCSGSGHRCLVLWRVVVRNCDNCF